MNEKKGLGFGARVGIAFAMSFVPFLLYMIPPVDAALTSIAVASNPSNPSKSDFVSFMTFGMPCVFFCATLFCFYRADRRKEKQKEKSLQEEEQKKQCEKKQLQDAIAIKQKHFAQNDKVKLLGTYLADDMERCIKTTDRQASIRRIVVTGHISVSCCSITTEITENDIRLGRDKYHVKRRLDFEKERVYLADPTLDTLAISKAIAEEASRILAKKMPCDPLGGIREIACHHSSGTDLYIGDGCYHPGPYSRATVQYEAENANYIEAKPL